MIGHTENIHRDLYSIANRLRQSAASSRAEVVRWASHANRGCTLLCRDSIHSVRRNSTRRVGWAFRPVRSGPSLLEELADPEEVALANPDRDKGTGKDTDRASWANWGRDRLQSRHRFLPDRLQNGDRHHPIRRRRHLRDFHDRQIHRPIRHHRRWQLLDRSCLLIQQPTPLPSKGSQPQ